MRLGQNSDSNSCDAKERVGIPDCIESMGAIFDATVTKLLQLDRVF